MNYSLYEALKELERAVLDKGPAPFHHDHVVRQHRREWPTLWKAIDKVLEEFESEP